MEDVPKEKQLALEFLNISAWVPDILGPKAKGNFMEKTYKKLRKSRAKKPIEDKPMERQVLFPVLERDGLAVGMH